MNIKPKIIRFLSPLRRLHNKIYTFLLAAYLGKTIIILGHIDQNILDWIFHFFVYSPKGEEIKELYRVVSSQTMGKKLYWLKKIYEGDINIVNKEVKTTLRVESSANIIIGNKTFKTIIEILDKLISDIRNPLVHTNYFLGYGNEYEWRLSYHRFSFNKKKDDFDNLPFTLKEARAYLSTVTQIKKELEKLFFHALHESLPPM